ncbi:RHS repeat-associated protein [Anaerosolibacter carboniphilus]|uniref:RHS repeat-associated protein n=1 Tax=Anaerosolibacter carboniphilus TaxID=1417629 RepID=A0A841KY56_9FIRM|nr:DUF6531 domain-containing protein [Anaerosolibacter carboniphilus]MBB6217238.1 RHS repeat-associated protein [Anaerosolibacter carboniphilus]
MNKNWQKYVSFLLVFAIMFTIVLPIETFADENQTQTKFTKAQPAVINPYKGEATKILWNFQYQQTASVKIYRSDDTDKKDPIKTIHEAKVYPGEFVTNMETWDGTDDAGNVVPNGTYLVYILPQGEWNMYPSETKVMILDKPSKDIALAPSVEGEPFLLYGSAEENETGEEEYTDSVEVFMDGASIGNANVVGGMWSMDITLPAYKKVKITAVKTNKVPETITDENGSHIEWESEEIDLGPISVLKHIVRPQDSLALMAGYYYGNSDKHIDIMKDNELIAPYIVYLDNELLVFDPVIDGEPPKSKSDEYKDVEFLCGTVNLITGETTPDPVNIATGNFIYSHEDIRIDGGFPVSFSRFYNSRDLYNGDLGMNWHHNFEYRLQVMKDESIEIIAYDGKREIYKLLNSRTYEPPVGIHNELAKNSDRTYTLTMENKWKYHFNERGQLTSIVDNNGNKTSLTYKNMRIREIRNDSGYLVLQYYRDGRIEMISDQTGRYVSYTYDGDELASYRDPEGNVIEYRYGNKHQLTQVISPLKDGSVRNIYDDKGRVIEQTFPDNNKMYFDYDDVNRTTTVTERDGSKVVYKFDERYRITEKIFSDGMEKKTFNDKDEMTSYTDKKGNTYTYEYDDQGNVTLVKDPLGYITRYTYDHNNKVTSITQPDGKVHSFTYDNNGNLLTSTDPMNRTIEYRDYQKGLPRKMVQPDGSQVEMRYDSKGNIYEMVDPLGHVTKFEYDELNRVKAIIEPEGNRTSLEYTKTGEIKKVTDAENNSASYLYTANGKLKEVKDQNGNITKYEYDQADQLIKVTDPLNSITEYQYDKRGNVEKIIDANGGITIYGYDDQDRLISAKDPENYVYEYQYDPNGNMIKTIDPKKNEINFEYDALNRLEKAKDANQAETKYEYDSVGRIKKLTNALNNTIEYDYYDDGKVKTVKDEMNNITSFTYNKLGLVETVTDAKGAIMKYEYNSLGKMTKMIDPEGAVTEWKYDRNGNVKTTIDALGNETHYAYDRLNRVKTIIDALGHRKSFEYTKMGQVSATIDENGNRTEYKYDAQGNLIEVIDAKGHSTKYVYDKLGNLTEIHQRRSLDRQDIADFTQMTFLSVPENQTVADGVYTDTGSEQEQTVVESVYGSDDIPLLTQLENGEATVAGAVYTQMLSPFTDLQSTFFSYDKRGLMTKARDAAGKVTIYEYDANGNLISQKDRDGYTTTYDYDPNNLLKKINYNNEKQVEFKYNPLGQMTEMKDWLGTTKLDLDPLGRILKVTDFDNRITEYSWSPTGEKKSITYADGSQVSYGYDLAERLTSVKDHFGKLTRYQYDPLGNVVEKILPNGSKTQYEYDAVSQITELQELSPTGKITDRYKYYYDPAGNKIKISKERNDLDIEVVAGEEWEETTYKYDPLNQLTEVMENNQENRKYFYDTLGNRVRMEEWIGNEVKEAISYQYDELNRLIATYDDIITDQEEDGEKIYEYDNRGNLIKLRTEGRIFNKYDYDATNKLVKVTNKHNDITKYTYDGFGNRIKTITQLDHSGGDNRPLPPGQGGDNPGNHYGNDGDNPGNHYGNDNNHGNPKPGWGHQNKRDYMEQNFVVDITSPYNNVLMIYGDHYQIQRYTYGLDRLSMDMWMIEDHDNGWIPRGLETNLSGTPERVYYLQDELGSTTKLIGEDGKTSAHYNYDEFGRPLSFRKFDQNWSGPDNTFGYTGYQYDAAAEMWYAQARYYEPKIGRFISEDPWSGTQVQPNTMNPYPYVLNNPLKYVDPLGLAPKKWNGCEEIIVASGQEGDVGRFKYNFIETAIKQINDYKRLNPKQLITWMIDKGSYSATDIKNFENTANSLNVSIVFVNSKQEFVNYINTGSVKGNASRSMTISNFTLFGHGHPGELNFGSNYDIKISDLSSINNSAFNKTNSTFYSCNAGTGGDSSFAQAWANLTGGNVKAMVLKTDYDFIAYTKEQHEIIKNRSFIQRGRYKVFGEPDPDIAKIKEDRKATGYRQEGSLRFPVEGKEAYWKYFIAK